MYRKILVFVLLVLIGVSFQFAGKAAPAYANGPCSSSWFYFDGTMPKITNVVGVVTQLDSIGPSLCTGNAEWSSSSYWAMMGVDNQDVCSYAQSGLIRTPNLALKIFSEHTTDCTSPFFTRIIWGNAQAGTHTYRVKYVPTIHAAKMKYDGNLIVSTDFDPAVLWGRSRTGRSMG
jgi:hypothetical protein